MSRSPQGKSGRHSHWRPRLQDPRAQRTNIMDGKAALKVKLKFIKNITNTYNNKIASPLKPFLKQGGVYQLDHQRCHKSTCDCHREGSQKSEIGKEWAWPYRKCVANSTSQGFQCLSGCHRHSGLQDCRGGRGLEGADVSGKASVEEVGLRVGIRGWMGFGCSSRSFHLARPQGCPGSLQHSPQALSLLDMGS